VVLGPPPCWPRTETAHHYPWRYFRGGRGGNAWSYDALITYFVWLLRPADVYVTNLAKCFFGDAKTQTSEVFATCARHHFVRELEMFKPNVVLSFTKRVRTSRDLLDLGIPPESSIKVVLPALHPAARGLSGSAEAKLATFHDGVMAGEVVLRDLGLEVESISTLWSQHVALFTPR